MFGMFGVFSFFFIVVFILVIGTIVFSIIKSASQWGYNNRQPVLNVQARVTSKRANTTHHHSMNDNMMDSTSTSYYVTFEVESGDRIELHVPSREYGLLAEGDYGKLSFQGTRYLGFERDRTDSYKPSDEL